MITVAVEGTKHDWKPLHEFWFGPGQNAEDLDSRNRIKSRMRFWFYKNSDIDEEIKTRFAPLLESFKRGELEDWKKSPKAYVTLIVLLDQIPRNAFRGTPQAHEHDDEALLLSKAAIAMMLDRTLSLSETLFLYMPFQHSENVQDQKRSVQHFTALEARAPKDLRKFFTESREFAERHLEPIVRFGRFPHRNSYLNRESTPEEIEYLKDPRHSF